MTKCSLCNRRIWPWQRATVGGQHQNCNHIMRVGYEMGRRDHVTLIRDVIKDSATAGLKIRALREYVRRSDEGRLGGGDAA